MKKLWSKRIQELEAYVPGEQPKDRRYIKLNTNENPYPPSPAAVAAMENAVGDTLRLYPDPECTELVEAIAARFGLEKNRIFVGNGSDEVLAMCFPAFFDSDRPILFPDITYSFYPVYAGLYQVPYETVALNEDFTVPVEGFLRPNGGVIIANPNAPTGIALPIKAIERIAAGNPESVVVVDEAYVDFGGETALPLIAQYPNVLVVRTTSKSYSLAGLRVGWAMGDPGLIAALNTVKNSINSYTLDRVAIAGGAAAIADAEYFGSCCERVIATRERSMAALRELGFHCLPSAANFIFAAPTKIGAEELVKKLREHGVLVRYFKKPRIDGFLRISVGSDEEMDALIAAVKEITE
ncbi:MAG: histidinol-phosphate transaminase [Clostridiales bacterium]|nr:histidinol-phosphate transaminase [Clostridiales bacterium]